MNEPFSANAALLEGRALLTRRELAQVLGLCPRTISTLQAQRKIPVIKLSSRCCRYDLVAVLFALERLTIQEAKASP